MGGTGASAPPPPPHRTAKSTGAARTSSLPRRDRRFVVATSGKYPLYKLVTGTCILAILALHLCTWDPLPLPLLGLAAALIRRAPTPGLPIGDNTASAILAEAMSALVPAQPC
jgi:hypothetical protein